MPSGGTETAHILIAEDENRLPSFIAKGLTAREVAEVQGADELVRKPFQFADLLESVQEHLAQTR